MVIDLTTTESKSYPVDGLGEVWTGRETYWTPDGAAVLLGRSWVALGEPLEYTNGWRIDIDDGAVTRLGFSPSYAALLEDGTVVADHWSEAGGLHGHVWLRSRPVGRRDSAGRAATRTPSSTNRQDEGSGGRRCVSSPRSRRIVLGTGAGSSSSTIRVVLLALLPVVGTENNGGGGRVIGPGH